MRLCALVFLAATPALAETAPASQIRVLDGDTVALGTEHIRIADIDAPEIFHADCPAAYKIGMKAKARLIQLMTGHAIYIERTGKDRYRRTLARLRLDGPSGLNLGGQLVREDLAVIYEPGHAAWVERKLYFCGPDDWTPRP